MTTLRRLVFALDLKDDPELQAEYRRRHQSVPPAITASIREAGILSMQIYQLDDRLFMIMEVTESFDLTDQANRDLANPEVQAWETAMWRFQRPLPGSAPGEKWRLMTPVFTLDPPAAT